MLKFYQVLLCAVVADGRLEPFIYAGSRGVLPEKHYSRKRDCSLRLPACRLGHAHASVFATLASVAVRLGKRKDKKCTRLSFPPPSGNLLLDSRKREIKTHGLQPWHHPLQGPEKHSSRKRDCCLAAACLSARKWSRKRSRFARLCRSKTLELSKRD